MSLREARAMSEVLSEAECIDLLRRTPTSMLYRYIKDYTEEAPEEGKPFQLFMCQYKKRWNELARKEDRIYWNDVFERAGISNTYGYKLISGHKFTLKRDTILRICLACRMDLGNVTEALRCAGLPSLRARNARDAVIIAAFCRGMTDPTEVSRVLEANGQAALEPCGMSAAEEDLRQIG